jgi:hypothetical protein
MSVFLATLVFFVLVANCPEPPATETGLVKGVITISGMPLAQGKIQFHPARGKPVEARITVDSRYSVKKLPIGAYTVTIVLARSHRKPTIISSPNVLPGFFMRVFFQPFHGRVDLRRVLQADGWTLEGGQGDTFLAQHPDVADQAAARSRLDQLRLLTSAGLRIHFLPASADISVWRPGRPTV